MHALQHRADRSAAGCARPLPPLAIWILGIVTVAGIRPAAAQEPTHPLDALTVREYWTVHDVLRQSGHLDAASTFAGVWLEQPPKSKVVGWRPGEPSRREARVVIKQGLRAYRAVVDIANARLASWTPIEGAQANFTQEDFDFDIDGLVRSDERVRAALARRGITDLATIECTGVAPGYIGEQVSGRLVWADCRDRHGALDPHGRTIGGLVMLVDMEAKQVLRVVDDEITPVPRGADLDPAFLGRARDVPSRILVQQPQGPGFKVDGSQVSWQNWRFHLRVDPRVGAVISNVAYDDGGRLRSVLYQGHLSEIFVPYMDPTSTWYFASYLDVGARSLDFPKPLERGTDCPSHAVFVDGLNTNHRGFPHLIPRAACLFEREAGDIAWRHRTDDRNVESRVRRDLVVRVIGTIGNYDYLIDWVFMQDGAIKVVAGATGMVNTKPVANRTVPSDAQQPADGNGNSRTAGRANPPPPAADAYGRFVDENTVAVNHDHFLSFRLDLDVDGTANRFVVDRLVARSVQAPTVQRSLWTVESTTLGSEQDAQLEAHMDRPALWRVVSARGRGPLGYPTSYQIRPGHGAISTVDPRDPIQMTAGFARHQLWVTRQSDAEWLAAGDHPVGRKGEGGLPVWSRANRKIEDEDLVVWYTMGMHHVPRSEDWPVMPTVWHELEIRPFDFFARNPALDLPRR